MVKNRIPTDQEFAEASRRMKATMELDSGVREAIFSSLPRNIPCHDIWVSSQVNNVSTINFIYKCDKDLEEHEISGARKAVEGTIKKTLESLGFDGCSIEYHSHEYVVKQHNGNYNQYFR
jgi:hypothetical protein